MQQTNKQTNKTNNKRPYFLPIINKVLLSPILQNLKGRSVLDNFFLKMIILTSWKRCNQAKSSIFSGSWSKTQNGIYLSLTDCKNVPFKNGFKKQDTGSSRICNTFLCGNCLVILNIWMRHVYIHACLSLEIKFNKQVCF